MATHSWVDLQIPEAERLAEPLSIAAVVMYSRPFMGGVRLRLGENDLKGLTTEQRAAHEHLRAYRDKHVAHSVNVFEENVPRANYCVERVREEGITGISYGSGRIVSLSGADLNALIDLATALEAHVRALITTEQERLLPIVRGMSLEAVLAGGQKAFVASSSDVAVRRSR
jgi:hypothetical protein